MCRLVTNVDRNMSRLFPETVSSAERQTTLPLKPKSTESLQANWKDFPPGKT